MNAHGHRLHGLYITKHQGYMFGLLKLSLVAVGLGLTNCCGNGKFVATLNKLLALLPVGY